MIVGHRGQVDVARVVDDAVGHKRVERVMCRAGAAGLASVPRWRTGSSPQDLAATSAPDPINRTSPRRARTACGWPMRPGSPAGRGMFWLAAVRDAFTSGSWAGGWSYRATPTWSRAHASTPPPRPSRHLGQPCRETASKCLKIFCQLQCRAEQDVIFEVARGRPDEVGLMECLQDPVHDP